MKNQETGIQVHDEMIQDRSGKTTSIWAVYLNGHIVSVEFTNKGLLTAKVEFDQPREWLSREVA